MLAVIPFCVTAQSVQVREEAARIEGENTSGYQVAFEANSAAVKNSLNRFLKTYGKVRSAGEYLSVPEPIIGGTKRTTTLYATTKQLASTTAAWIGVFPEPGGDEALSADVRKLAYDFGVTFQKEQIQAQIDESVQALEAVQKQQVRLSNQNKELSNRIERNKRQKIQLEKSLEANKLELEQLTKDIAANANAQDSIMVATDQIRKVVEMHKARQQQVK